MRRRYTISTAVSRQAYCGNRHTSISRRHFVPARPFVEVSYAFVQQRSSLSHGPYRGRMRVIQFDTDTRGVDFIHGSREHYGEV